MRNFELPGRFLTVARKGMAATSHVAATLAAVDAPRDGGNAIDGAVTACAVQRMVEAGSTGIGGDCKRTPHERTADELRHAALH